MSRFKLFISLLFLLSSGMAGCFVLPAAPDPTATNAPPIPSAPILPTETAAPQQPAATVETTGSVPPRYVNEELGFSFDPPAGWEILEYPDYVLFSRPGAALFVGFQRADEPPKPFRTGMAAGELVASGTTSLLSQPVPKSILVAQGKNKTVDYGGRMRIGELVLVIYLDATGTPQVPAYEDFHLTPDLIAEADRVVASFKLASGETPPVETSP
jgi:hypothetical protein